MARPTPTTEQDLERWSEPVRAIVEEVRARPDFDEDALHAILRRHPRDGNGVFSKAQLLRTYRHLVDHGRSEADETVVARLQMKPVRSVSGVAPVTVLTKPWPCPGKCIFCPTDVRMPKSYLHDEPGAMRAEQHAFDPWEQTSSRIEALAGNGHAVDKIELLVLGGTWSSYPADYQEWFLRRCFDAMNGRDASTLEEAHAWNESAAHRNVGLVLETRPDHVDPAEIRRLRRLGATKIQMGAQSLDDRILALNRRGHTVDQLRRAMRLLRAAGFKLVLHWMPNLHGATPEGDVEDFARLWSDVDLRPDELKIYSTQLLPNAELMEVYQRGEYQPWPEEVLLDVVARCKAQVPEYCRINRVYRDIPATNVVDGCRLTNMRQVLEGVMAARGLRCRCIRCREVRGGRVSDEELVFDDLVYRGGAAEEHFLHFHHRSDDHHRAASGRDPRLAAYLRLSLPERPGRAGDEPLEMPELEAAALVREVHVVGPSRPLGLGSNGWAQHRGLGGQLLRRAEDLARSAGYARVTVIASVGTRAWYARHGYRPAGTYMVKELRKGN